MNYHVLLTHKAEQDVSRAGRRKRPAVVRRAVGECRRHPLVRSVDGPDRDLGIASRSLPCDGGSPGNRLRNPGTWIRPAAGTVSSVVSDRWEIGRHLAHLALCGGMPSHETIFDKARDAVVRESVLSDREPSNRDCVGWLASRSSSTACRAGPRRPSSEPDRARVDRDRLGRGSLEPTRQSLEEQLDQRVANPGRISDCLLPRDELREVVVVEWVRLDTPTDSAESFRHAIDRWIPSNSRRLN